MPEREDTRNSTGGLKGLDRSVWCDCISVFWPPLIHIVFLALLGLGLFISNTGVMAALHTPEAEMSVCGHTHVLGHWY